MNAVADSVRIGQNGNGAPCGNTKRAVETLSLGAEAKWKPALTSGFSQKPPRQSSGAVPCLTTFMRDRQRLLRSWATLQRHLPPEALKAEEQATLSAMRQLRQLCQEGACHEQG